jgi:hypothetical protein
MNTRDNREAHQRWCERKIALCLRGFADCRAEARKLPIGSRERVNWLNMAIECGVDSEYWIRRAQDPFQVVERKISTGSERCEFYVHRNRGEIWMSHRKFSPCGIPCEVVSYCVDRVWSE